MRTLALTFQFKNKNLISRKICFSLLSAFTLLMPLEPCLIKTLVTPQKRAVTISKR